MDLFNSDDPVEIDSFLREIIRGYRLSILAMGIGLAKIKSQGFFKKMGFRSMKAYMNNLAEGTAMDPHSFYTRLKIGEAYFKHKEELDKIGFSELTGPTKLPFLERALEAWDRDLVFTNLKEMSQRDFADFAVSVKNENIDNTEFYKTRGKIFYHDRKRAVIINKSLDSKTINMLMGANHVAFRALERKGVIVAVHLRNAKEARLFKVQARRIRKKIQKKRKSP